MADVPDADLDKADYIESFVTIAAQIEDDKDTRWKPNRDGNPIGLKREETRINQAESVADYDAMAAVPAVRPRPRAPETIPTTTALTVAPSQHDKRNPFAVSGDG